MGHGMHELSGAAFTSGIEKRRIRDEKDRKVEEGNERKGKQAAKGNVRVILHARQDGLRMERGDLLGRITNTCTQYYDLS